MDTDDALAAVRHAAASHAGLRLLVLHGSRSRGRQHAGSDWDFGYRADDRFDPSLLQAGLTEVLGTDRVDLTDLDRASALLRFEAARHGIAVHEGAPGAFQEFALAATLFWCAAEPVIRRAHEAVLASLPHDPAQPTPESDATDVPPTRG